MIDQNELLELVETLVHEQKGEYLSDLQRIILLASLDDSGKRKTYEAIAEETGYSPKYIKQGIAPTLWQLMSELFGEKVGKSNIRAVLTQYEKDHPSPPKPVQQAASQPEETPKASPLAPTAAIQTSNAKAVILLVDDQPQNLARRHVERHIVHRRHQAFVCLELEGQIFNVDQLAGHFLLSE